MSSTLTLVIFVLALFALGVTSRRVADAHRREVRAGRTPSRWLARLERWRQYLANEGPAE